MLKKISFIAAGFMFTGFLFSSCGGGEENVDYNKEGEQTTDTMSNEARVDFSLIRANIPSPNTLLEKFSKAGFNYNKAILNPTSRSGSYTGKYAQALNLGVFGADLSYCTSYKQSQDMLEYFGVLGKLAKDVGIDAAFDPEMGKQLIQNVGKNDTIEMTIDQAFDRAEKNLRSNMRVATTCLVITGGWIEGLYIACQNLSKATDPRKIEHLYHDIYVHCHAFDYVFSLLDTYKKDPDCAKLLNDMKDEKQVLLGAGKNPKLGQNELVLLTETITTLRNKIIK